MRVQIPKGKGNFGVVQPIGKHCETLLWCVQKRLNCLKCCLGLTHVGPRNHILHKGQVGQVINTRFHRFPIGLYDIWTQRRSVSPCKLSEHNFESYCKESFFPKNAQKLLTKFPRLATSGHHNSAMITDRRKFTTKLTLRGMPSFHFYL